MISPLLPIIMRGPFVRRSGTKGKGGTCLIVGFAPEDGTATGGGIIESSPRTAEIDFFSFPSPRFRFFAHDDDDLRVRFTLSDDFFLFASFLLLSFNIANDTLAPIEKEIDLFCQSSVSPRSASTIFLP